MSLGDDEPSMLTELIFDAPHLGKSFVIEADLRRDTVGSLLRQIEAEVDMSRRQFQVALAPEFWGALPLKEKDPAMSLLEAGVRQWDCFIILSPENHTMSHGTGEPSLRTELKFDVEERGKSFALEVDLHRDTVSSLLDRVEREACLSRWRIDVALVPEHGGDLRLKKVKLPDETTLWAAGVRTENSFNVEMSGWVREFGIRGLRPGEFFEAPINRDMRVQDVLNAIEIEQGIPAENVRLVLAGKVRGAEEKLSPEIYGETIVHMVRRRGENENENERERQIREENLDLRSRRDAWRDQKQLERKIAENRRTTPIHCYSFHLGEEFTINVSLDHDTVGFFIHSLKSEAQIWKNMYELALSPALSLDGVPRSTILREAGLRSEHRVVIFDKKEPLGCRIFLKSLARGETFEIPAALDDFVVEFKERVEKITNIRAQEQELIFKTLLQNEHTLQYYGIADKDTLQLFRRFIC